MKSNNRVLVVDDKEENLYYLEALLGAKGWIVDSARHGAEALVMARKNPPLLIISDLLMPVMDGYTLLRHWKADCQLKTIPFVVYTATYTAPEDERLALNMGADKFILKPAEPDVFLEAISEVLTQSIRPGPVTLRDPSTDETSLLATYSETLIRKLEEKTLQLEEMNRALNRDLAERKVIEQSLRESEERFRELAENIQEVFWITDPEKRQMLYISPAYKTIWGRPTAALYSSPRAWIDAIHPQDRERVAKAALMKQTQGDYNEIYRIIRPEGEVRWIHDRAFPVLNSSGLVYRVVGIAADITERTQANEKLKEQAALLDKAQDAILVRDLEHRILYWNASAERLYGWKAEEAIGRLVPELIYRDQPAFNKAWAITQAKGEWSGEIEQVTREGKSVMVESHWTLVRGEANEPKSVLVINTDVTARKKLEAQFLRTQRTESIGILAGGIAHDLNNVLSPILMSLDVLDSKINDEEGQYLLATLKSSVERGADLVKQVLSFARGMEGKRVTIQLLRIAREIQNIVRDTFPKNITLVVEAAHDLWPVIGDPTQLHQVLMNLCVNSRDAMPNGGRLAIKLKNLLVDDSPTRACVELEPGAYVCIEVSDTGEGIPPDIRDKIFEPFFTTKVIGRGTGLGLSTTMTIVKGHGGFLQLVSDIDCGTTFCIYLPADILGRESEIAAEPPLISTRGNQELILVVDDENAVRIAVKMILERHGYSVLTAANGAEAVSAYAQHGATIAVVLTDMAMPVMDGPATIVALRSINPRVKIIASSGLPANHDLANKINGFVNKPYTADTLIKAISEVVQSPVNSTWGK